MQARYASWILLEKNSLSIRQPLYVSTDHKVPSITTGYSDTIA